MQIRLIVFITNNLLLLLLVSGSSKSVPSPGTLQRSRSDIDVNAAAGAKARHASGQTAGAGRLSAAGLPPGSYASLGEGNIFIFVFIGELFLRLFFKELQEDKPTFGKLSLSFLLECCKRAHFLT